MLGADPGAIRVRYLVVDPGEGPASRPRDDLRSLPEHTALRRGSRRSPGDEGKFRQTQDRRDEIVRLLLPGRCPDQLEGKRVERRSVQGVEPHTQGLHPPVRQTVLDQPVPLGGSPPGRHQPMRLVALGPTGGLRGVRIERPVHIDQQYRAHRPPPARPHATGLRRERPAAFLGVPGSARLAALGHHAIT